MSVDRGCIEIQTSELSHTEDVRIHTCWIAGDFTLPGQPGFHLREDRGWVLGLRLQGSILLLHSDSGAERPRLLVLSSPDYRATLSLCPRDGHVPSAAGNRYTEMSSGYLSLLSRGPLPPCSLSGAVRW